MSSLIYRHCLAALVAVSVVSSVEATPIFETFGPFPNATFGGSGIPNDSVAASRQIIDGDTQITIALSATQRFSNPPLVVDALNAPGVYTATNGSNFGGAGQSTTEGAKWNFNYYVEVSSISGVNDPSISDYDIQLLYDFDPGADTPFSSLGFIDFDLFAPSATISTFEDGPSGEVAQGSQNLLFNFLGLPLSVNNSGVPVAPGSPGSIPLIVPPVTSFDPDDTGEYTFAIGVSSGAFPLESVAIDVVVIPEPAGLALLGVGSLALLSRRRAK
ncbi:MAG: PEP-CTERM sorting domain-containing protein [Planctomycetota bacterium]